MSVARRALIAVLAAAALVALLPAAPASAAVKTKVIVSLKFPAFHGTLKSKRASCLASRKVKLYRKTSGPAKLLGSDRSNANGKWSIPIGKKRLTSGSYFATVTASGNCKGGKSNVLPIG